MKTSIKIFISTITLLIFLISALYFNVKAEVNKYVTGELNLPKHKIEAFSNIVVNAKSTVNMYMSENNAILGDAELSNFKIQNDTLYISDTSFVKINFKSIKSITSNYGSNITIDSINTSKLNIYVTNNSEINIRKGEVKNLKLISDSSSTYMSNCILSNINGKLNNNSFFRFNSRIESVNIKSDTSSYFNSHGWRRKH